MRDARRKLRLLGFLVLALASLVNAGCLIAAVGAGAAGAAAAGYTWCNGLLYRDYPASLADTTAAVRASLVELQFPIIKETSDTGTVFLRTRTGNDDTVRIYLDVVSSPIPAEGGAHPRVHPGRFLRRQGRHRSHPRSSKPTSRGGSWHATHRDRRLVARRGDDFPAGTAVERSDGSPTARAAGQAVTSP